MDLLGPSLEDLFSFCGRKFQLKTTLMVADQLVTRVEYVHSKNYIHRDIKPDNFLIGLGKRSNQVFLIDFGLAKKFRDAKTHQHIPYKENKNLTGTARYASINAHLGIEQSRRDDLEAIGYVLIYFIKGKLPWQGVNAQNKGEKYHKIMEKKMSIPVEYLCLGIPCKILFILTLGVAEFATYMHYCRSLRFEDRPDYGFLRKMFKELMVKESIDYDYVFDWTFTEAPKKQSIHMSQQPGAPRIVLCNKNRVEDPSSSLALNPPQSQIMEGGAKPGEEEKKEGGSAKDDKSKSGYAKSNTANFGSEEGDKEDKKEKKGKKGADKEAKEGEDEEGKGEKDKDKEKEKGKGKKEGKDNEDEKEDEEAKDEDGDEEKGDSKKEVKKTMRDAYKQKGSVD